MPKRQRKTARTPAQPAAKAKPEAVAGPLLEVYEQGIRAMYRQKWAEAGRLFARVAEAADEPELQERARQQLAACRAKQEEEKSQGPPADPFLLAVYHKNRGNFGEALQLCARGGRQSKDERFAYLAASIHALSGQEEEAARFLELAIDLNPKNRVHAFHDPDFAQLRERGELGRLFGR